MTPVAPVVESGLIDLSDVSLERLLEQEGDSNLALAVKRIRDEAQSVARSDSVSAFNSSL
jgi:hypothetical protein